MLGNIIVAVIVLLIIGLAVRYILKEKKKGIRCIGCPSAGHCQGGCSNTPPGHNGK